VEIDVCNIEFYHYTNDDGISFLYGMDNLGNVMPVVQNLQNLHQFSDSTVIISDTNVAVDSVTLDVDAEHPSLSEPDLGSNEKFTSRKRKRCEQQWKKNVQKKSKAASN